MFEFKLMLKEMREMINIKIAWALPHQLVLWCFLRVAAYATQGKWGTENPDDVSVMQAIDRWMEGTGCD